MLKKIALGMAAATVALVPLAVSADGHKCSNDVWKKGHVTWQDCCRC
jgi:hypothetical protein